MSEHTPELDAVLTRARALLEAVDFDNNGSVVGMARMGGNGGLTSLETTRAADALRLAFDRLGDGNGEAWQLIETAPKDGTFVILSLPFPFRPMIGAWQSYEGVARWGADPESFMEEEHFLAYWHEVRYEPTHWRPMPEGPR